MVKSGALNSRSPRHLTFICNGKHYTGCIDSVYLSRVNVFSKVVDANKLRDSYCVKYEYYPVYE